MNCRYVLSTRDCDRHAMYLVAPPFGSFLPYCRSHMTAVVVAATRSEYHEHPAGQRNPVQVLPLDDRNYHLPYTQSAPR